MSDMKKALLKPLRPMGLPWWLCAGIIIVVFAAAATGALPTGLAGTMALMLSIGIIFNEIGERIPIWNTYVGGESCWHFWAAHFCLPTN